MVPDDADVVVLIGNGRPERDDAAFLPLLEVGDFLDRSNGIARENGVGNRMLSIP